MANWSDCIHLISLGKNRTLLKRFPYAEKTGVPAVDTAFICALVSKINDFNLGGSALCCDFSCFLGRADHKHILLVRNNAHGPAEKFTNMSLLFATLTFPSHATLLIKM